MSLYLFTNSKDNTDTNLKSVQFGMVRLLNVVGNMYNFIRHIGSHIQYKKAMYSKQNDEKVNNSVTIFFNNTFELVT